MADVDTQGLPLLAIPGGVIVPGMVVTIAVESEEALGAVEAARDADNRLVVVPKLPHRYATVGTIARIEQSDRLPGGRRGVLIRGLSRARVGAAVAGNGRGTWVAVEPVEDRVVDDERITDLATRYRAVLEGILAHRGAAGALSSTLDEIDDAGQLADTAIYSPDLSPEQKVEVLETLDVAQRLEKVLGWAQETLAELDVRAKIREDVTESLENRQREAILRQQLQAIRQELKAAAAESGDDEDEIAELREKAEELPEAIRTKVLKEIDRYESTAEQSPERSWIRTWLDRIFEIPWTERSEDQLDLEQARRILDEDHTGLGDVKDRIVEQLAIRKLRIERGLEPVDGDRPSRRGDGMVLALVGPPGVGKTSLGESVARALGRRYTRVALGGIRDEAEIRGHRRTYVGAQPGRIARAIAEAGTMNPVILLDEIDKVGSDWRGDPSSALLEVLDPAQNHTFRDHYLEVDLDLSEVLFIATANVVETIPGPLLDRLEVVTLDGYTDDEKVAIARDHLLRRQLTRVGLSETEVELSDEVLRQIVEGWTREAGVRQLERQIGKVLRKIATKVAGGAPTPVVVEDPSEHLGRRRVFNEVAERTTIPGVATGLAVTGVGGDVLFVETTAFDQPGAGSGGEVSLQTTGQLGDVMKESASIALSFLRAHAAEVGLDPDAFAGRRFHVHFPAGAVPKDGPSAGITMTTALASLLSGRRVRSGVGMTGEVTLQGRVLPIGGVKQKLLAAHRAGLTEVVLPKRNEPDLEDVPDNVLQDLTIHLVDDVREVLRLALESEGAHPQEADEPVAA